MPVTIQEYPKGRPNFFAYRLTRLMFKAAIANDIGPEACYLITQVAMTEDATRYSKAVRFYNEQLMPVCGFTNVKALDRARKKAVQSGWLIYIPGGKSKAGLYWTVVPEQYLYLSDTPIDDSNSSSELQAAPQDETSLPATGKETGDKRERNARETPEKRATIYPIPISNPKEETPSAKSFEVETRNKRHPMAEYLPEPNAAVHGIEDNGELVMYQDDPERWEVLLVRWWNERAGVVPWPHDGLDDHARRLLYQRMMDPKWTWKRTAGEFPLHFPSDWKPSLDWFLETGNVTKIIGKRFKQTKDKANERSNQAGLFGNRESDPTRVRTGSTTDAVAAAFAEAAAKRGE